MATNIKTVMTYPLDGSTTDFNIPFEYLARKFVQVTLIGVDRKVLVLNQDYRFATKATISTTKAWGPGDGYQQIEIRRYTSATERLVDFTDGSILRAYDLNISQIQTLHVAEEARDLTADTIAVNNDGHLDARGRRIVNVADSVDDGDAINLRSMKRWNDSALNSANRAKDSEVMAEKWSNANEDVPVTGGAYSAKHHAIKASKAEVASKLSETNAKNSESAANSSANSASASASSAATSATSARDSATTATAQAGVATSKASESAASAVKAKEEADRAQSANPDNQLKKAENLNDIPDKAAARSNISVYSKAEIGSKLGYSLVDFGSMGAGQRKVLPNPFGNSTPVITVAQVLVNGEWADAGWLYQPTSGVGIGCRAGFTELGIVVITGSGGIKGSNTALTGGIHETQVAATIPANVRVHVWKVQP